MPPTEPPRPFVDAVHGALQLWHREPAAGSPLQDFPPVRRLLATGANLRRATNEVLLAGLRALEAERPSDVALLRARFLDGKPVFVVANERNIAEVTVYTIQRRAIVELAAGLLRLEEQAAAGQQAELARRMPAATYDRLLGVEPHLQHLAAQLLTPAAPWIVAIEGLGGLGKTALAHQLVTRLAAPAQGFADGRTDGPANASRAFAAFAWVSARQPAFSVGAAVGDAPGDALGDALPAGARPGSEGGGTSAPAGLPALTVEALVEQLSVQLLGSAAPAGTAQALVALETRLRMAPHLVVVDNLETPVDVAAILPVVARLAGPSKFLLTSRTAVHDMVAVYRFPVPELTEADSLDLVRNEARLRNLPHVATADDVALHPLFATVGGNPLALRLVTGQLHLLSLAQVIENLREAQGKKAEDLYRFIYWKAWQQLPGDAQDTLLLMPLFAGEGADLAAVQRVSDLPGPALIDALEYLVRLCLVNVSGDLQARRFGIHRLTESFLVREVLKWQRGDEEGA